MQKDKAGKIAAMIIILCVIGIALYVFTNSSNRKATDNSQEASESVGTNNAENENAAAGIDEQIETEEGTITPTPTVVGAGENAVQRNLAFFMDKDGDGIKDDNEGNCQDCNGKNVVLAGSPNQSGKITSLKTVSISGSAKISESFAGNASQIWGVNNDKYLLILPTDFSFGDNVNDVEIPVQTITGVVAGVNANISNITNESGMVKYELSTLIPSMQNAFTKEETIWVKYTPSTSDPNIYYLTDSVIVEENNSYVIYADWGQAENSVNMLNVANVDFVIK